MRNFFFSLYPFIFYIILCFEQKIFSMDEHQMSSMPMISTESTKNMGNCSDMEYWDVAMWMCVPFPQENISIQMAMIFGNGFATQIFEQGHRGKNYFASPNLYMIDGALTLGANNTLNVNFMGTFELWTFPKFGYPELLQIGETYANGLPYIDAQHPHTTPIMGITIGDTIRFSQNSRDYLNIFFAPRGQSTDGPVVYLLRPTGIPNPDTPLGHHIGQDVGHISNTVIGGEIKLTNTHLQFSTFNGTEPEPTSTSLTLATPNSFAFRLIQEFSSEIMAMGSVAYVKKPEPNEPNIFYEMRYSASAYTQSKLGKNWEYSTTSIFGLITKYDHATYLISFLHEFLFQAKHPEIWGRLEVLQRTPNELNILNVSNPNKGKWVSSLTLGYTHLLVNFGGGGLGIGASGTMDFLPREFCSTYGSCIPLTGKIFLELLGTGMWMRN